jgi:hypothetical protein
VAYFFDPAAIVRCPITTLWQAGTAAFAETLALFLVAKCAAKSGVLALEGRNDAVWIVGTALRRVFRERREDAACDGHDGEMFWMLFWMLFRASSRWSFVVSYRLCRRG